MTTSDARKRNAENARVTVRVGTPIFERGVGPITIQAPVVPHGPVGVPEHLATVDYLRTAADRIESSRMFGSNLTATIVRLIHNAADARLDAGAES